jgi:hypothetical protein
MEPELLVAGWGLPLRETNQGEFHPIGTNQCEEHESGLSVTDRAVANVINDRQNDARSSKDSLLSRARRFQGRHRRKVRRRYCVRQRANSLLSMRTGLTHRQDLPLDDVHGGTSALRNDLSSRKCGDLPLGGFIEQSWIGGKSAGIGPPVIPTGDLSRQSGRVRAGTPVRSAISLMVSGSA